MAGKKKRGNGEGCITKSNGQWIAILTWSAGGKRHRRTRHAATRSAAVAKLDELKRIRDNGLPVGTVPQTTAQYLDWWIRDMVTGQREPATVASYSLAVKNHISPRIGHIRLPELCPLLIQSWIAAMIRDEVGSRTQQNAYRVLSTALDFAVDVQGSLPSHPCKGIPTPKHEPEQIYPFTVDEVLKILKATAGTRWHALATLLFTAGLRIGEALGLEWAKIDFPGRSVLIDQQASEVSGRVTLKKPKTKHSIRRVGLTPGAIESLKLHKAILLAEGNAASSLVFPAPEGGVSGRGNVRARWWDPLLLQLVIEPRGIHHSRHTYATHALLAGVSPLVVCRDLGHSKPSITLDIYGHVLKKAESQATDAIAKLFG